MDYKQKYEEALERIRKYQGAWINKDGNEFIQDIFPEFVEIEDEKIRKELIRLLNVMTDGIIENYTPIPLKDFITWLEKQGEQKPIMEMKTVEESLGISSEEYNDILNKCLYDESKPADKVEPKFKVGDWVTDGEYIWKITDIKRLDYILQSQNGDTVDDTISYVDEQFHLWTIQDAKDGDVLATRRSVFIFKKEYIAGKPEAHCGAMNGYFIAEPEGCWTNEKCNPATKEQRNLLFQKMKKSGYEWDADKKELKKIEQKLDSKGMDLAEEEMTPFQKKVFCIVDTAIEEEQGLSNICNELLSLAEKEIEQKPAWSEEDEDAISMAIEALEDLYDEDCPTDSFIGHNLSFDEAAKRLKVLKTQSHWKPTEEQMSCFKQAIDLFKMKVNDDLVLRILNSLYNDLKKL